MLTKERAQYLWNTRGPFNEIRNAFIPEGALVGFAVYEDGLTIEEDAYVRKIWEQHPNRGPMCWMDVFHNIRLGRKTS